MRLSVLKTLAVMLALSALALAQAIPAGTHLNVRLGSELSSGKSTVGQAWEGSLAKDVVSNGKTVAKAGTPVTGKVTHAKASGRLHHPGELTIRLTSIGGQPVQSSSVFVKGKSHKKSNVGK